MSAVRRRSRADRRKRSAAIPHNDRRRSDLRELEIKMEVKETNLLVWVKNPLIATNCYSLRDAIRQGLQNTSATRIIVNMEQVPYADTTGICLLIDLQRQYLKGKIEFIIFRICPRLKEIIELLNLNGILKLRDH